MDTITAEDLIDAVGLKYVDGMIHCVGLAKSRGNRCKNAVNAENRARSQLLWEDLSTILDRPREVREMLEDLATRLLCKRQHRDQYLNIANQWQAKIQDLVLRQQHRQTRERRTRPLPAPHFPDTPDSGYESTSSSVVPGGDDSDTETIIARASRRPSVETGTTVERASRQDADNTRAARQRSNLPTVTGQRAIQNARTVIAANEQPASNTSAAEARLAAIESSLTALAREQRVDRSADQQSYPVDLTAIASQLAECKSSVDALTTALKAKNAEAPPSVPDPDEDMPDAETVQPPRARIEPRNHFIQSWIDDETCSNFTATGVWTPLSTEYAESIDTGILTPLTTAFSGFTLTGIHTPPSTYYTDSIDSGIETPLSTAFSDETATDIRTLSSSEAGPKAITKFAQQSPDLVRKAVFTTLMFFVFDLVLRIQ